MGQSGTEEDGTQTEAAGEEEPEAAESENTEEATGGEEPVGTAA